MRTSIRDTKSNEYYDLWLTYDDVLYTLPQTEYDALAFVGHPLSDDDAVSLIEEKLGIAPERVCIIREINRLIYNPATNRLSTHGGIIDRSPISAACGNLNFVMFLYETTIPERAVDSFRYSKVCMMVNGELIFCEDFERYSREDAILSLDYKPYDYEATCSYGNPYD